MIENCGYFYCLNSSSSTRFYCHENIFCNSISSVFVWENRREKGSIRKGKGVRLSDIANNLVSINFMELWIYWCQICNSQRNHTHPFQHSELKEHRRGRRRRLNKKKSKRILFWFTEPCVCILHICKKALFNSLYQWWEFIAIAIAFRSAWVFHFTMEKF